MSSRLNLQGHEVSTVSGVGPGSGYHKGFSKTMFAGKGVELTQHASRSGLLGGW